MNCPNCRERNEEIKVCKNCGINIPIFLRSLKISARFYNRALIKSRSFEFYEAITLLENSIKFDKKNINARNLLGLLYFEVGLVGDALKQWILSQKMNKKDNLATFYLEKAQSEASYLQVQDNAIKVYNKAIFHIQDGDLIAGIEYLHEAINLNPKFIEALNLLSLIYIQKKENASEYIGKVLSLDKTNKTALLYEKYMRPHIRKELNNRQVPKPKPHQTIEKNNVSKLPAQQFSKQTSRRIISFTHIISFLIGGAAVSAMFYLMIIPGLLEDRDLTLESLNLRYIQMQQAANDDIIAKSQTIEELTILTENLQQSLDVQRAHIEIQENLTTLQNAVDYNAAGNHNAAAELLFSLDFDRLPSHMLQTAENLRSTTFAFATMSFYNSGLNYFESSRYNEARNAFEQSLQFSVDGQVHRGNIIYFLGRIFEIFGQYEQAIQSFELVLREHPNSSMINETHIALQRVTSEMANSLLDSLVG
ncbi:MAG: tetratricopeptide repeat protein [Defluviitaleaceae bacterium]|nr:tetratricopeptide repeat protein [Defluviitaleaceae bacterium]